MGTHSRNLHIMHSFHARNVTYHNMGSLLRFFPAFSFFIISLFETVRSTTTRTAPHCSLATSLRYVALQRAILLVGQRRQWSFRGSETERIIARKMTFQCCTKRSDIVEPKLRVQCCQKESWRYDGILSQLLPLTFPKQ